MKLLARAEEVILLTILKLEDEAYGVNIREQIHKDSGDLWSFASIYSPLDKLRRKGFVEKEKGTPQPERGGKSKYYYRVTQEGRQALIRIREAQEKFWSGIPKIALKKETKS
jgi:DNA-binding PadR family transcriptional regulator